MLCSFPRPPTLPGVSLSLLRLQPPSLSVLLPLPGHCGTWQLHFWVEDMPPEICEAKAEEAFLEGLPAPWAVFPLPIQSQEQPEMQGALWLPFARH